MYDRAAVTWLSRTIHEPRASPLSSPAVLDAEERRFGPLEVAPPLVLRDDVAGLLTTCQKKLFAERNARLPPRSR